MPTYTQPVSFSAQSLIAPDLVVQQQQNQRQQELAAALRNMSFEPIQSNGGNIAWTQGMAKLAQALAGRVIQGRADKQAVTLNQAWANKLNGDKAYGYYDPPPSTGPTPAPTPHPISLPTAGTGAPPTVRQVPTGPPPQLGGATSQQPAQVDNLAPLPDASAQAGPSPQQPPASPQAAPQPQMPQQGDLMPSAAPQSVPPPHGAFHPGPLTLSGNPDRDRYLSVAYPDEFGKGIVANAAPVEMARTVQQAQEAMARGDIATATALLGKVQKDNHMALESLRPGSLYKDPETGRWGYAPKIGEGQTPQLDANGNVLSVGVIPGADTSATTMATAEARGKAAFTPTQVLGNDNRFHTTPLTGVPGFGGTTPSPAGSPPAQTGTLGHYYANRGAGTDGASGGGGTATNPGNVSGLSPGGKSAAEAAGTNSANVFNDAINGGNSAKDTMRSIDNIMTAARGLSTGTGAGAQSAVKSGFNALADGTGLSSLVNPVLAPFGKQVGFDRQTIAKYDEIRKNAAMLADQLSKGGGAKGTDARLANAINALPNQNYSPAAIQEVGLNLKAVAARNVAYGAAAANWQQQHGPDTSAEFQGTWQKAYNPDLFYHMQKGDFQQWTKGMSPYAAQGILQQYRTLKSLGAI